MERCWRVIAAGIVCVVPVSCSGSSTPQTRTTEPPATIQTRITDGDGRLRIGVLLPTSGEPGILAQPLQRAIDLAVADVNEAGGVFGRDIEIVRADEGVDSATAGRHLEELLTETPVDAVIGPASSRVALALRDRVATGQMPTCSPVATAAALSSSADNGYFFRTIPGDLLQAAALAQAIDRTGAKNMAVTYPDDEYGRRFADSVAQYAARSGLRVSAAVAYDPNARDYRDLAARLFSATPPEALAFVGAGSVGAKVLSTLRSNGGAQTPTFVNDAMRGAGAMPGKLVTNNWLERVSGVAAQSAPSNGVWAKRFDEVTKGAAANFAAYAYDCVMLIALATLASGSEVPARLAGSVVSVSRGGAPCTTFATCRELITQGLNIDLIGTSGPLDLDDYGDVSAGSFEQFSFDATGRDVLSPDVLSV